MSREFKPAGPGESPFSPSDELTPRLEREICQSIERESGLLMDQAGRRDLRRDLLLRMNKSGCASFNSYWRLLQDSERGPGEMQALINLLTINETYFMRIEEHFDILREHVLPTLLEQRPQRPLKIWSAGCSSGEEAYSILITLLESGCRPDSLRILGTDINQEMLEIARKGIFSGRTLRKIPPQILAKYFNSGPSGHVFKSELRSALEFRQHNLLQPGPAEQLPLFDIVFCRNVIIYFSRESTRQIIDFFYRQLKPDGFLFLGPSETLWNVSSNFEPLMFTKSFVYRRLNKPAKPEPVRPAAPHAVEKTTDRYCSAGNGSKQTLPTVDDQLSILAEEVEVLISLGDYQRAVSLVEDMLLLNPGHRPAYLLQASIMANLEQKAELQALASTLQERIPIFPEFNYLLGRFYEAADDWHNAAAEYRKVLFIEPRFLAARNRLYRVLFKNGKLREAEREQRNLAETLASGNWKPMQIPLWREDAVAEAARLLKHLPLSGE